MTWTSRGWIVLLPGDDGVVVPKSMQKCRTRWHHAVEDYLFGSKSCCSLGE